MCSAPSRRFSAERLGWPPRAVGPLLGALTLAVFAALAVFYVRCGWLNPDEGFYGMAARQAWQGAMPYRDFGYPQMPLLPYLNGALMRVVGFGFFEQRAVNAAWGGLTLLALLLTARHLRSAVTSWGAASLALASSLGWVHYVCMGKTHAAAGLFLLLAGICLVWQGAPYRLRCLLFAACAGLAVDIRLTTAPSLAVLALGLALQGRTWRERLLALLAPAAVAVALALPFVLADPEGFLFWNLRYHLASSLDRRSLETWTAHFYVAPGVWTLFFVAGAAAARARRGWREPATCVLVAAALGLLVQLGLPSTYFEYSVPYAGLCALAVMLCLGEPEGRLAGVRRALLFLPCALPFVLPRPPVQEDLAAQLREAARFLAEHTGAQAPILASTPVLPLEAGRNVLPGLEAAPFAFTTELSPEEAQRLHLHTPQSLAAALDSGVVGAVVMHVGRSPPNFSWSVPSIRPTRPADLAPLRQRIHASRFSMGYQNSLFTIILPRKPAPSRPR